MKASFLVEQRFQGDVQYVILILMSAVSVVRPRGRKTHFIRMISESRQYSYSLVCTKMINSRMFQGERYLCSLEMRLTTTNNLCVYFESRRIIGLSTGFNKDDSEVRTEGEIDYDKTHSELRSERGIHCDKAY